MKKENPKSVRNNKIWLFTKIINKILKEFKLEADIMKFGKEFQSLM